MPGKGKPFAKGNKASAGIQKPNAGRPADWFRAMCQKALNDCQGVEVMRAIASGEDFPQLATGEGEVLPLPPSLKDRQRAIEWLADRGFGKATQTLEHTGESGRMVLIFPGEEPKA